MDVRALRYFVEVVEQQSFTRAAEALHVTQPTISKMVRALEDELGGPLLIRDGRRLQLTDAGRVVLERGRAVLAEVGRLRRDVADVEGLARGELTVGIPPTAGPYFAPVIGAYRRRHPGVTLRLREQGARALEAGVAEGGLDIGVTLLPLGWPELATQLAQLSVARQSVVALFPRARAPAHPGPVALAELAGLPFVMYEDDFALPRLIADGCRAAGFTPEIAAQSRYWDFIGDLVGADVGVAILPAHVAGRFDPARVDCRPLASPALIWELGLVWRQGYLSRAARAWLDCCREEFGLAPSPDAPPLP